ncbi:adenylate/guanylate cyclase domain-containing protein [Gordonia rhizosphera]|uniref:Adenylate cyclase n=1 Tax=Gordonia rhizosphera NBRC 16068 TaxID=1108045 RepID=K6WBI3_9ACTN|nr:adenylate/guanylate cyclase domain-containing protein [Gordonia rhizosphera]GAB91121.1 adenylate cyclase [Gordonia rhizosphera NBRC 16068]
MGAHGASRDYGSILLGSAAESPVHRRIRIQALLTASIVLANLVGAGVAILLAGVGIPEPSVFQSRLWWVNYIAVPVYIAAAFVIGIVLGTLVVIRDLTWSIQGRAPTAKDARRTQRAPWRLVVIQAGLWAAATVIFTTMYGVIDPALIPKTFFVVTLSGVVVVSLSYLFIEFALRPVMAEVISAGYRRRKRSGIRSRAIVAWLVGSAVPIVGILLVVLFGVFRGKTSKLDLFVGVTVLAIIALATGLLLTLLTSARVTGPLRSVRTAMGRVQGGDTDVDLVVYDGTELGDLQVGFNAMVTGLRERERMHDLFGRHVGRHVADAALRSDPELGGTERTVAVVFVDVIGSTTSAAGRSPTEVVDVLNRFFAVIVRSVESRGGLVNKFEGDAVLAIFGAPIELGDPAGAALSAAREIASDLVVEVPDLSAGIGVGYGRVVAGNVGAIERFEYTVIGDPVNESARLSELAKRDPCRPLASGRAIDAAVGDAGVWERQETTTLRGRAEETVVYAARMAD